jgi:hypothetical protein
MPPQGITSRPRTRFTSDCPARTESVRGLADQRADRRAPSCEAKVPCDCPHARDSRLARRVISLRTTRCRQRRSHDPHPSRGRLAALHAVGDLTALDLRPVVIRLLACHLARLAALGERLQARHHLLLLRDAVRLRPGLGPLLVSGCLSQSSRPVDARARRDPPRDLASPPCYPPHRGSAITGTTSAIPCHDTRGTAAASRAALLVGQTAARSARARTAPDMDRRRDRLTRAKDLPACGNLTSSSRSSSDSSASASRTS